jgi:TRAP-type C4-dicarboxylate transport system permease small subunit
VAAGSHVHAVHLCDLHLYLTAISEALHGTPRLIVEIIIRLVVLGVAFCLVWFGYINYLRGFGSFRLPSGTPIASLYAAIPLAGLLIGLFTIEQLVNGIRNGFDHPEPPEDDADIRPADAPVPTRVGL